VAGGVVALPYLEERRRFKAAVTTTIAVVLAVGVGAGAVSAVARAGHSGAKAAWHDVQADDDHGGRGPG
jgi:hypothetical protein